MARILIVDDSAVMRLNLRKILTDSGHDVVGEAPNGKVALNLYEKLLPDLVTMDITMPIMSGVDATGLIISKYPEAKIVMISALNQKKMVYDALKNGAKHYIIKPIDKEKVMSVLSEVLMTESDDAGPEEAEPVKKAAESRGPHFHIENVSGVFVIRFRPGFTNLDMDDMNTAMQGILFISPLKLKFDFGDLTEFNDGYLNRIMVYAKKALESGGEYEFVAGTENLKEIILFKEETYLHEKHDSADF